MTWSEIEKRIKKFPKDNVFIIRVVAKYSNTHSLFIDGKRHFDVNTPQFKRLIDLGYGHETKIFK